MLNALVFTEDETEAQGGEGAPTPAASQQKAVFSHKSVSPELTLLSTKPVCPKVWDTFHVFRF